MADGRDAAGDPPRGGARPPAEPATGGPSAEAAFAAEYPGADLLSAQVARALERAGTTTSAGIARVWRSFGLSHAAGNALAVIEGNAGPMTPGEISAAMHTTSGSITSLIDTLAKKGLVRRTVHGEDRRKVLVDVTEAGQDLLDAALPSVVLRARDMQAALDPQQQRDLLALIESYQASIAAVDLSVVPAGTRHRPDHLTRRD